MALIQTNPKRRRYGVAALAGVLGGIVSAIVKFGWEVPLPPRTPERNATNPPQELLQQLGLPESVTHLSYTYNGNEGLPWVSFMVHFAFSIGFAVLYCVLAERFPQIKLWQGAAFGIFVYVAFHVVLMPLMGTVPAPWNQPFAEHLSEFFGHIIWLWAIEVFRRDMRNRITHEPDAEVPLESRTTGSPLARTDGWAPEPYGSGAHPLSLRACRPRVPSASAPARPGLVDQNAGMTEPSDQVFSMYCFTSSECRSFSSFAMASAFLESSFQTRTFTAGLSTGDSTTSASPEMVLPPS